jgi:hypothetical protein
LMEFLTSRNSKATERFDGIATEYMRHGEELSLRWDIAFFQMMLETGNLTFTGDVDIKQNNFAGLGATGRKAPGETFKSISDGVRAHLQHVQMYSGERVEDPVAERTRNVQDWNVLGPWQKTIKGPITFTHLAKKWAPTSRGYSSDISDIAEDCMSGLCNKPDPKPELVAEARKGKSVATAEEKVAEMKTAESAEADTAKVSGKDIAQRAVDEARTSGDTARSALGAGDLARAAEAAKPEAETADAAKAQPAVTILNAEKTEEAVTAAPAPAETAALATPAIEGAKTATDKAAEPPAKVQLAAAGTAPAAAKLKPAPKCNVLTASYGGQKSIIIKAKADGVDSYTVLDVNEGSEKREADAYIAAYAKGGQTVGEFSNQNSALDKAFELCPEG